MRMLATYVIRAISFAVVGTLISCGGGGGGGGDAAPATLTPSQLTIDNTNASTAAGAAVGATTSSTSIGPTGAAIIGGVSVNGATTNIGLAQFAEWQLTELSRLPPQPVNLIGAVVISGSETCSGGGSYSYGYDDTDNNGRLSVGETFSTTFSNCIISAGAPANGSFTLALSSLTGTPGVGAWSGSLTMTFSDFNMSGEHLTGDITVQLSTGNSSDVSATLSGSSLSLTNSTGQASTMRSYSFGVVYNKTTNAYTISANATLNRSDLAGAVSFSTPTTLQGNFGNSPDYPTHGVLLVTGAGNSKVRLTAVDNTYVELAVDANGDGTYENISNTTWVALDTL